jgi:hypothetical protein
MVRPKPLLVSATDAAWLPLASAGSLFHADTQPESVEWLNRLLGAV